MKKSILLFALIIFLYSFIINVSAQEGWQRQNPPIPNVNFYSVYFPSKNIGYAVGDCGTVIKTFNAGETWTSIYSGIDGDLKLRSLHFINDSIGYVVDESKALKTNNGGQSWNMIGFLPGSLFESSSAGYFINSKIGYVADGIGSVYKTVNGGNSWTTNSLGSENDMINSMFFTDRDTGFAVGFTAGIMYYTDNGGNTWSQINTGFTNPLYSVYFTSHNIGYAVGGDGYSTGTIIKTSDGGNTWTQATSTNLTFNCVQFPDANTGYAAGDNGTILKYTTSTGLNEIKGNDNTINVYPNPVNDYAIINILDFSNKNEPVLELTDLNGNLIKNFTLNQKTTQLNISNLASGIYTIKIKDNSRVVVKRIVKE